MCLSCQLCTTPITILSLHFPSYSLTQPIITVIMLVATAPVVVLLFRNPMFPNDQAAILQMKMKGIWWAHLGIGVYSSDSQLTPYSLRSSKAALPRDPSVLRAFELAVSYLWSILLKIILWLPLYRLNIILDITF